MNSYPIDYENYTNMELYTDANPETTIKVGFKNKKAALKSIKDISHKSMDYQIKVIITLYYRAKFHPHQTENMRKAMKIFAKWLHKHSPTSLDKNWKIKSIQLYFAYLMGSGISLSDEQLTQIVKRDLKIEYNTLLATRKPCAVAWEKYRNELDKAKFIATNKRIDIIYNQRRNKLFI